MTSLSLDRQLEGLEPGLKPVHAGPEPGLSITRVLLHHVKIPIPRSHFRGGSLWGAKKS